MPRTLSDRRRFLSVVAATTTTAAIGCGSGGADPPSGPIAAGKVGDLPPGTLRAVSGHAVCIGHDTGGIYAMTLICTHQQCDMSTDGSVSASGVSCNCHGSRFSVNGAVQSGPASGPLDHFRVDIDGSGNMTIQADSVVDAAARTAVPG